MLGGKAGTTAPLHLLGQLAHGFLSKAAPFAAGKRSFLLVHRCKDFRAGALALLSQQKRLLHRVFLALKTPALNRLADKRSLIGRELHVHTPLA